MLILIVVCYCAVLSKMVITTKDKCHLMKLFRLLLISLTFVVTVSSQHRMIDNLFYVIIFKL